MFCGKCGVEMAPEDKVCKVCGWVPEEIADAEAATEETAAAVEEDATEAPAEEVAEEAVEETAEEVAEEAVGTADVVEEAEAVEAVDGDVIKPAVNANKFLKIGVPIILLAIIVIGVVVGFLCSSDGGNVGVAKYVPAEVTANPDPSATAAPVDNSTVPPAIADMEVKIDDQLFRYVAGMLMGNMNQQYTQYGMAMDQSVFDDDAFFDQLVTYAYQYATFYGVLEQKADEAGYEFPEEKKKETEDKVKQMVESCLKEGQTFDNDKDTVIKDEMIPLTYAQFVAVNLRLARCNEYVDSAPADADITEEMIENYYNENLENRFDVKKVKHILFKTMDDAGKPLSKAKTAKQKALADKVCKQINNGADIDKLIQKYTEDVNAEKAPNSDEDCEPGEYKVAKNSQLAEQFKNWGLKHEPKDKAAVVKTAYGYHVMKVSAHDITSKEDARKDIVADLLYSNTQAAAEKLTVERDEKALETIKAALRALLPPAPEVTAAPVEATAEATAETQPVDAA